MANFFGKIFMLGLGIGASTTKFFVAVSNTSSASTVTNGASSSAGVIFVVSRNARFLSDSNSRGALKLVQELNLCEAASRLFSLSDDDARALIRLHRDYLIDPVRENILVPTFVCNDSFFTPLTEKALWLLGQLRFNSGPRCVHTTFRVVPREPEPAVSAAPATAQSAARLTPS